VKYFFDNCISYRYVDMLQALDVDAVHLQSQFSPSIDDIDLFTALRGSSLVYLTCDTSQATREKEARALKESGVTALFLGPFWSKLDFWPEAQWLVTKWPVIDGFCRGADQGTIAAIKQNGRARYMNL
jgi:hypothetical protein